MHITYLHKDDDRRHKVHCTWFRNDKCLKKADTCFGSAHCREYSENLKLLKNIDKNLYLRKVSDFFDFWKRKNSDIIEMYLKNADINALRSIVYQDFTGFKDDFEHYFVAMINSVSEKKGHMGDEYIKVSCGMIEKELCQIFKSSIQASTGFNFSQKGLLKMLKDNDKTHLIKFISPFMIENACRKYNELYSKETKITLKFSINYERGTYIINCASENKKVNGKGKGMYLKIVRVRNNGEQIVDEGDNFKENIEEVKAALDKYTPGVYKAYMCFDKQGNMVASNGVFEEEK